MTTTDMRQSWEEVRSRLEELGLKLQLHLEQAAGEERAEHEDKIKEALRTVADAVDQAFTALGNAAGDEAVRDDLKDVGQSVADALDATFSELGERVRTLVKDR